MDEQAGGGIDVEAAILMTIGAAGAACAITLLFLGMRSVMGIGGFCAEGGPYTIAHHCPKGTPLVMMAGIWGGLIFAGVYVWGAVRAGAHSLVLLLWPALFLSLGWNFLTFGLNPPGQDGGVSWAWLICAVVFFLMGAVPLIPAVASAVHWVRRGSDHPATDWHTRFQIPSVSNLASTLSTMAGSRAGATTTAGAGGSDMVSELERLDALRRGGALTEDEYERAKGAVIEKGAGS